MTPLRSGSLQISHPSHPHCPVHQPTIQRPASRSSLRIDLVELLLHKVGHPLPVVAVVWTDTHKKRSESTQGGHRSPQAARIPSRHTQRSPYNLRSRTRTRQLVAEIRGQGGVGVTGEHDLNYAEWPVTNADAVSLKVTLFLSIGLS